MTETDNRKEIGKLISLGKENGYLTFKQVNDILPKHIKGTKRINEIYSIFDNMNIEVISSIEEMNRKQMYVQERKEEILDTKRLPKIKSEGFEPLRMYLKEMGKIPLLTREGEVELAKRIEKAKLALQACLGDCPPVVERLVGLAKRIKAGQLKILDVVKSAADYEQDDEDEIESATDSLIDDELEDERDNTEQLAREFLEKVDKAKRIYQRLKPMLDKRLQGKNITSKTEAQITACREQLRDIFCDITFTNNMFDSFVTLMEALNERFIDANRDIRRFESALGMDFDAY